MCIIVLKPQKEIVGKKTLETCYENNNHSCGVVAYYNNFAIGFKDLKFDSLYKQYINKINELKWDRRKILELWHFRIKSKGDLSIANAQPFFLTDDKGHFVGAFAHNGTMLHFGEGDISDSREVAEQIIPKLPPNWWEDESMKKVMLAILGNGRGVFIAPTGKYVIFNADKGEWDNGVWYSNTSYKPYTRSYTGYSYHHSHSGTSSVSIYKRTYNQKNRMFYKSLLDRNISFASVLYDPNKFTANGKGKCKACGSPLMAAVEYSTQFCHRCGHTLLIETGEIA